MKDVCREEGARCEENLETGAEKREARGGKLPGCASLGHTHS